MKKTISIAAIASALVSASAMPAAATGTSWTGSSDILIGNNIDFTYWDLDEYGGIGHSGIVHDADHDGILDNGEDLNDNGILDPSEDLNDNGVLDDGEDLDFDLNLDLAEDLDADGILDRSLDWEWDRVWCGSSGGLEIDGNEIQNTELTSVVDSNGDFVVSGSGEWIDVNGVTGADLDAKVEYRAYAEGDLLRTSYVVTNNTNSPIVVAPSTYDNTEDNYGEGSTSSGNGVFDSSDLWWTQFDTSFTGSNWLNDEDYEGQEFPSVVLGRYYGSPGHNEVDFDSTSFDPFNGDDDDVYFSDVTIQPGQSYQWIFFYQLLSYDLSGGANYNTDVANASVVAAAVAASDSAADEFGADLELTGRLARGLNADIDANWVIQTELAETGTDASGIALAGAALVAAGVAVAVRRRRASN